MPQIPALCYRFHLIALTAGLLFSQAIQAEDCGEIADQIGHGEIRWDEAAIYVQGTAAPNLLQKNMSMIKRGASRAARLDAYRKAASVLAGVSLTASLQVGDVPGATSRVRGFIQGARLCKSKFYADGGVDLVLRIPLVSVYKSLQTTEDPLDLATEVSNGTSSDGTDDGLEYTGLIVDVRDLSFVPAMAPMLSSPEGVTLLDEHTGGVGLPVQYVYPNSPGILTQVAGTRPLRVPAISLGDRSPSEIVLDPGTSALLAKDHGFRYAGKTVLIVSEPGRIDCRSMASRVNEAEVDWVNRIILSRGHGQVDFAADYEQAVQMRLMERAAEVDAERLLVTGAYELVTNGEIQGKPAPLVNAVRCGAKYFKDGKAEVVTAVPMDQLNVPLSWGAKIAEGEVASDTRVPTGVILNTSQIQDYVPSYSPKLVDPQGEVLYSNEFVTGAYGRTYGGAAYHSSNESAVLDKRTGAAPVEITPVGLVDNRPGVLQLSAEDAKIFRQLAQNSSVLKRGAVSIILPARQVITERESH